TSSSKLLRLRALSPTKPLTDARFPYPPTRVDRHARGLGADRLRPARQPRARRRANQALRPGQEADGRHGLPERDQVLPSAPVALSVRARDPAGAARPYLLVLQRRAARAGDRRRRGVRAREPDASAGRLLHVHAGTRLLRPGGELP